MDKKNIVVIGAGYVGMSISIMLARKNNVVVIEKDQKKVNLINKKKSPISDDLIESYLIKDDLTIKGSTDKNSAYQEADFALIAAPTDFDRDTNAFNTSIVENIISEIKAINRKCLIIIKSTVPIGFTSKQCSKYKTQNIIFSPEFLREGSALYDNLNPSRLILGCKKSKSIEQYANLINESTEKKDYPIIYMSPPEAEAVKLFSNAYLAMRVSFFNELDTFSHTHRLQTSKIIEGISADKRIGNYYNNPSFGYGGYCLPKDTKQLLSNFKNTPQALFDAIIDSNKIRKDYIGNQIIKIKPSVIGIFRLIMKSDSDNYRNSAIFDIINFLKKESEAEIIIYEPLSHESKIEDCVVINDLNFFKDKSNLIIANRASNELDDVESKVFTRDIFHSD